VANWLKSIVRDAQPGFVVARLQIVLIATLIGCRAPERSLQVSLPRTSLARFSEEQVYARCTWPSRMNDERLHPPRCEPDGSRATSTDLAARRREMARVQGAGDDYQRGRWRVVSAGEVASLVEGIQDLKRARSGHPLSANLENDFAASFLRLAEVADDSYSLFFGLEGLLKGLAEHPQNKLLLFNRAVAWDLLGVTDEAVRSWQKFRATEDGSPWADEASSRMSSLRVPLGASITGTEAWSPARLSEARERIIETLIPSWAQAVMRGETGKAALFLQEAEQLAGATDDQLSKAAITLLRSAALRPEKRQVRLAQAYLRLAKGIASRRRFDTGAAVATLATAGHQLAELGSSVALVADYQRALAIYHEDRYPEAAALLSRVQREAEERNEPLIRGLSTKALGLIAQVTGRPSLATKLYQDALDDVRRSGDLRERINVASILADGLLAAGHDKEAWRILHGALRAAWQHPDYLPRYVVAAAGAAMAEKRGFAYLATAMTRLSLMAIQGKGSPAAIADSATWYASSLVATGHLAQASAVLRQIRPLIDRLGDPRISRRANADLDCAEGRRMLNLGQADAALAKLRAAADYYEEVSLLTHAAPCRAAEGAALLALGNPTGASKLLERSLSLASRLDGFLPHVETLYGAGDPTVSLLESALTLNLERGKPWDALRIAALALQRNTPGKPSAAAIEVSGLRAAAVRLRGSGRTVLIVYSLPQGVVAWRLDGESIAVHRTAITQSEVSAAVEHFIGSIQRGETFATIEPQRSRLGRLLLGNLLQGLARGTTLVVVSTAELAALPWGFLGVPGSNEPIIDNWPVALAPNLQMALAPARRVLPAAEELLVVANPALPGDFQAPPLPHAEEEAAELIRLFPGKASALVGERATKRLVLRGISQFSAVHMAVHSISDPYAPRASHLVLRGDDGGLDPLTVEEILGLDLRRARIVVLAACKSSFRSTTLATNALGLGEAFLAAGAHAVVASGWAVDDAATSRLMTSLYGALATGATVADALRLAQLSELRHTPTGVLRNCAAFRVLGDPAVPLRATRGALNHE